MPHVGVTTTCDARLSGSRPSRCHSCRTGATVVAGSDSAAAVDRGRDTGQQHQPRSSAVPSASSQVRPTSVRSRDTPATPDSRNTSTGGSAAQQCATTVLSRSAAARTRAAQRRDDVARPAPRVRCRSGERRHVPGQHQRQHRLVELEDDGQPGSRRRTSATCAASASTIACPRSRSAPGIGEHGLAARQLQRGRQRPRAAHRRPSRARSDRPAPRRTRRGRD